MKNFVFYNPTKIIFGRETVDQIGKETALLGRKVLFVFGVKSIFETNLYSRVITALQKTGISIVEHGGVKSNPLLSHVRQGVEKAKLSSVEAIVAVGGGSVIDSAKAIAAGALVQHDVWQFFRGKKSIKKALPISCILTLAASGSEMNNGTVITNEETKQKFGIGNQLLFPAVSILDPTLTFTVNASYTAYGAVDAISHLLEFYLNAEDNFTPLQDGLMESLILTIMNSCEKALTDPCHYQARADLMWCSTLALNGLTGVGLGRIGFPMHMIEHSISSLYNVPHGAGLSIIIPAFLTYLADLRPDKVAQLAKRIFCLSGNSSPKLAHAAAAAFKSWFQKIGSPVSLSELGIPPEAIEDLAENALPLAKLWRLKEHDQATIENILRLCC